MEQVPHKCPVCNGEGTRAIVGYEPECRPCNGTGVVWGWKTSEPQYPPVQPVYPWWGINPPTTTPYVRDWETITICSGDITISGSATEMDVSAMGNVSFTPTA